MWFALRVSYIVAVVLCNIQLSLEDEDTKRSFLARRAIDGSRGRKYYDAKDDGFFEDYGFDRGHYRSQDKSGISDIRSNVPGEPGIDYPAYERLPQTSFSCEGHDRGYYADEEAGCQMFHVCDNILVSSFLCPVGSLFSQKLLTCDWWNKVDCSSTEKFYVINRNQYNEEDGDEMLRKAYVMLHLHPDGGIITEPEERARQPKIVHYSRVDAPENDLPNNYDDLSNDQENHQFSSNQFSSNFDDYSNFKTKPNAREEDNQNDPVLYSQEYQTHAPKIYPESPIVRIHKINDHLAYQNRKQSKSKEQSSYRFPLNEFVNDFQPSYAPTVPTVTTTTRRYYSPTVPMSYRSSTLAYDKLDQNLDSSIHIFAHGKNSVSASTPATEYSRDFGNPGNYTRGSKKFEELKNEPEDRRVNYNGGRDDYGERETYDQLYDEEQERFEIMEGRESGGLVRSSGRSEETTVENPILRVQSKAEDSSGAENSTLTEPDGLGSNSTRSVNSGFEKEASDFKEGVTSSTLDSGEEREKDLQNRAAFTEATNVDRFEDQISGDQRSEGQRSKDDHEPNPDPDVHASTTVAREDTEDQWEHDHNFKGYDAHSISSTTSHPFDNIAAQLLHPQEQFIVALSPILLPPLETYEPFNTNVEDTAQISTTTRSIRVPIPYQHYTNVEESDAQPNSTENSYNEKSATNDEQTKTTSTPDINTNLEYSDIGPSESEEPAINVPATEIIPPLESQDERISDFVLNDQSEQKDDGSQLINSSNHRVDIQAPSIHEQPPKFIQTNPNYEAHILREYNPNLDFTIRTALWDQQHSSGNEDTFDPNIPVEENRFFNHRSISLDLEPPNEDPPSDFEREPLTPPAFESRATEQQFEDKENVSKVSSVLKPAFPSSISEIEDTIEESNAPYQVTLTVDGETDPKTLEKDFISRLVSQHEKGNPKRFTNFENFEIAKSEEPKIPGTRRKAATDYSKGSSASKHDLDDCLKPIIESMNSELASETHNRTGKNAEIRNVDADVQRIGILQLMTELAKANRLPRPFSTQESVISRSRTESSSRPISRTSSRLFANSLLNSGSRFSNSSSSNRTLGTNKNQSNSDSSSRSHPLKKEEILEQLKKSFGQPLYGNQKGGLVELPKQETESLFELPEAGKIKDFKTGKAIVRSGADQFSGVSEASSTSKTVEDKTAKTVVEMEFLPSLGFSFDTHEGREEYAQAIIRGLVTEGTVLKSDEKFSTSTVASESTERTKNLEKKF